MSRLTLADALMLPAFRRAEPVVVAGADFLDRTIRWAHATEQDDVVPLLRTGDLVLTMGTGLPVDDDAKGFDRFVEGLADAESSGLVVELGKRWKKQVSATLAASCEAHSMPLVVLTHETRFAALTQALGERIVDSQLDELLEAQRVHETFTELSFDQAGPGDILEAVCRLAGGPVVVENAQHRPLDFLAGAEAATGFLDGWQARSRRVNISGRTGWDRVNGWLVTSLGTATQDWGRLVIASPSAPSHRLVAVAERAAAALALHRLHDRDRDNLIRRTHRELIAALQTTPDAPDLLERCDATGFPTRRRQFVGLVARPPLPRGGGDAAEAVSAVVRAAHTSRVPALVCDADREVQVLLSISAGGDADLIADRLGHRVNEAVDVVIAAGRVTTTRDGIARSLLEARQVADAVPSTSKGTASRQAPYVHRLEDLHLRGLLGLFGEDDRIKLFVDRELHLLREADKSTGGRGDLVAALTALLKHPGSKSDAAASLHVSRAAFYDRLAKIERILGADLDDPDVRVSLHVAIIADEVSQARA